MCLVFVQDPTAAEASQMGLRASRALLKVLRARPHHSSRQQWEVGEREGSTKGTQSSRSLSQLLFRAVGAKTTLRMYRGTGGIAPRCDPGTGCDRHRHSDRLLAGNRVPPNSRQSHRHPWAPEPGSSPGLREENTTGPAGRCPSPCPESQHDAHSPPWPRLPRSHAVSCIHSPPTCSRWERGKGRSLQASTPALSVSPFSLRAPPELPLPWPVQPVLPSSTDPCSYGTACGRPQRKGSGG